MLHRPPAPPPSLPRSLALQVVLPRAAVLLGWLALNHWIRLPVPLVFALISADGLFLLWQSRALLRSADAHVQSTGAMAPVWGGYLLMLFAGFAALTQWWDALLIARAIEEPAYAEQRRMEREALYSLSVSGDGRSLRLRGEITYGLTKRLRRLAADNPSLVQVDLAGPGGLIAEARGAAQLIRQRGWDTRADGLCASACTLVFAAGRRRTLGSGGQLGFHSYTLMFGSGLPQVDLQREQEKDRAFLLGQGVSAEFAARIFAVPGTELWLPGRDELLGAGLIGPEPQ
ncbi:hypothetical protein KUV26_05420 [Leisingera daeponensis]|uniref:Uncharacterized protein n=1 Tax=Leisingera daeponensis TaxID=405746 RepID=A0ABS7NCF0_9RHOB|nr:hypothetical protein [Leisingera daeponensis]MBY6055511.1 hypothetical protein [Leisingera daeponensis]MBY6138872.1 hypothetical protein [Leisingera daeponensis]